MRTLVVMSKAQGLTVNGAVLRMCRLRILKTSIADAAERAGVDPSLWSKWELGARRISPENLELVNDLIGLDDPAPLLTSTAIAAEEEAERRRLRRNKPALVA